MKPFPGLLYDGSRNPADGCLVGVGAGEVKPAPVKVEKEQAQVIARGRALAEVFHEVPRVTTDSGTLCHG